MANVNLITRAAAEKIAANYFENEKVHSLFVTRDGQVFYADKKHYMRMHERSNKLESSWYFERESVKIPVKKEEIVLEESHELQYEEVESINEPTMSYKSLKEYFQKLTDEGKIEVDKWNQNDKPLKFAQLRELYEEINKD